MSPPHDPVAHTLDDIRSDTLAGAPDTSRRALRLGIGGPVGSGKTTLVHAVCTLLRDEMSVAVVTNDIFTTVLPGPIDRPSSTRTTLTVEDGSRVVWWPEPTVSVAASDHDALTTVRLSGSACATVVEEIVLGRTDEPSGDLQASLRVEVDGRADFHHTETFGPRTAGAGSAVSVGSARHVLTAVIVDGGTRPHGASAPSGHSPIVEPTVRAARLALDDGAWAVLVAAADRPSALSAAARLGLVRDARTMSAPVRAPEAGTVMSALV